VRDGEGRPQHYAAEISPGMALRIEFADGQIAAIAGGDAPAEIKRPAKPKSKPPGQGSLF
jgi:exodeoxyribonuclease VII large subunit